MRHRLVWITTAFVAAAHWLVMFESPPWTGFITTTEPHPTTPLHAVWIKPEPVVPSAAPVPPPTPRKVATPPARPRAAQQTATPIPISTPEPVAADDAAIAVAAVAAVAPKAFEALEPSFSEVDTPEPSDAATVPAGPRLHVRSSAGDTVNVDLPTDGSALQQQTQLRFQVHGFVKGMEYHAQAELSWRTEGHTYEARQSVSAFLLGSMEQTSTGLLTAQGLQPLHFSDRRFAKRRNVHFDWDTQHATFEPLRAPAPIGAGAQDRLSVFLQLAALLQALPELRAPGTRIDIPTVGSRRLQMWTFVVEQEEALELSGSATPTLRLQRQPQAGDDETAQLWLDPALGYVPVRIHLEERNGDVMDFMRRV